MACMIIRVLNKKVPYTKVERIKKAISHGLKGSAKLLSDTGKEVDKAQRKRHKLPKYLYNTPTHDRRATRRPDLVLIMRPGDRASIPPQYCAP